MADSPAEFAHKLRRLPTEIKRREGRAIYARARITAEHIVASARSRSKAAGPKWVMFRVRGDVAEVRLRGGFAYLTEKGSYKKPDGWEEGPKAISARRRANAAKKGQTLGEGKALATPEGPRARVHHPRLRARPFWEKGILSSRIPGKRAYEREAVHSAITTVF